MSVPRSLNVAPFLKVEGALLSAVDLVGLGRPPDFLPLRASILLEAGGILEIDRGLHPVNFTVRSIGSAVSRPSSGISFLTLEKLAAPSEPAPDIARRLRTVTVDLAGHRLKRLLVDGNCTLAVSLLPWRILFETDRGAGLDLRIERLGSAASQSYLEALSLPSGVPRPGTLHGLLPHWTGPGTGL